MNRGMIWGTLSRTESGRLAVLEQIKDVPDLADLILRSIEDKSALLDVRRSFRWSPDVDMAIQSLIRLGFIRLDKSTTDRMKDMFVEKLGLKRSQIMITKLDHICRKNGSCNSHGLESLKLTATHFFGEATADSLQSEIMAILKDVDPENGDKDPEISAEKRPAVIPAIEVEISSPEY